jgi:hypothetical protein
MSDRAGWKRWRRHADGVVVAAIFAFHLASFDPSSAVHGPNEIFAQDSVYILESLVEDEPYSWNSQNHLLYHAVVELGYDGWKAAFGPGPASAYRYLKLFTALCGLLFFVFFRQVLLELGLGTARRALLLVLTGVSVAVWFHFSAFETHCTAMPALALYLLALVRLRDRNARPLADRALFVASLLVCGWSRVDLFRFAAFSAPLPLLPGARRHARGLAVDLALVAVLGLAGNAVIASLYYGDPPWETADEVFERHDRRQLRERLGRPDNLAPRHLVDVGRAVALYGILAPVEPREPGRGFFAPPRYVLDLPRTVDGENPSTGLYLQPARNLWTTAPSALALAGVLAVLLAAGAWSFRRLLAGDPLHGMIAVHAAAGWLSYTWFNPHEPFLWVLEYVPLWIVAIADASRGTPRAAWIALGLVTAAVAAHNWFAFYVPFA